MTCRDCGNKSTSRHQPTIRQSNPVALSGDLDSQESVPGKGFEGSSTGLQKTPTEAFLEAKRMSYEDLVERRNFQNRMADAQKEGIIAEMSEAMKRFHIDELVATINCARSGIPGMSREQAIVELFTVLERPDFSFINAIHPDLREAVTQKYKQLMADRLFFK